MSDSNTVLMTYNPLRKWERFFSIPFLPEQMILLWISFTTLLAAAGEISAGGFMFRGWAWAMTLLVCLFYLIPNKGRIAVRCNIWIWLPWVAWMAYKTDFSQREPFQRFFIFLTPLITMCACSSFRLVTVAMIQTALKWLSVGSILIYLLAAAQNRSFLAATSWYSIAGIAMTFTLLAVAACADLSSSPRKAILWLSVYFLILLLSESRMPVLAVPFIFGFGLNYVSWKKKTLIALAIIAGGLGLFYTGPVQENLFNSGYGTLAQLFSFDPTVLNTSGRLTAWPEFLNGIEHPWTGDGATSSAEFGYATFRGWTHPHNEYIRILFDYGIIGFILLSIPALWLIIGLYQQAMRQRNNTSMRWLYSVCVNGFLAMLLLGITGNVLMYISYNGNFLFAVIGCACVIQKV
jgi:O-antigen ligase